MTSHNFEIDWVKLWLEKGSFTLADNWIAGSQGHITTRLKSNDFLTIEASGKVVKSSTYLGGITQENFDLFHQEVLKAGVILSKETLLNARLSKLDVKKDIHFLGTNLSDAISLFRERAIPSTQNFHMLLFKKQLGINNSLLIKTTTKTTVDSLSIYNKFQEMYNERKQDLGYYDSFDDEFLDSCKDILRFERRIYGAKKLRQVLHLQGGEKVTLQAVFDCPFDILQEKIDQHLDIKRIGGYLSC